MYTGVGEKTQKYLYRCIKNKQGAALKTYAHLLISLVRLVKWLTLRCSRLLDPRFNTESLVNLLISGLTRPECSASSSIRLVSSLISSEIKLLKDTFKISQVRQVVHIQRLQLTAFRQV